LAERLLSEYIDNRLSARETMELDKHFAGCNSCTRALNETRRTVAIVSQSPAFSVSDEFVANLQARLAHVEPEPARRAWLGDLREALRLRARPLWATGLGASALAVVFVAMKPHEVQVAPVAQPSTKVAASRFVHTAKMHSIALAASDPFGDTAAANVAASIETPTTPPPADAQGGSVY
jgi:anti-sigma factor RsiW